ncbi:hypothetical protein NGR_c11600 [Sinorhizobium fredii NGR234]|uniref:DNA ligase (ATP) n=1 Tax=Sinorhizobium fredii (strain NBRC 101917 / NGR234) TaxID=394 RepID=C3MAV2_SINFN|nr:hypothetical protein NGR_c11600 [Sinorhizobium fredii NGR234]
MAPAEMGYGGRKTRDYAPRKSPARGTGWTYRESVKLRELLDEIRTDQPDVVLRRKGAVFTRPVLVAEVEYRAWTLDGKLRHLSFKGIRERVDDTTVFNLGR